MEDRWSLLEVLSSRNVSGLESVVVTGMKKSSDSLMEEYRKLN